MQKVGRISSLIVGLVGLGVAHGAIAQVAVATYEFNNSLVADQSGVVSLVAVNPAGTNGYTTATPFGQSRTVYRFAGDQVNSASSAAQEGGLQLNTTGLIANNSYSVEMVVSLDQTAGYRRLTETQNRASDNGFYVINSRLQEYPEPQSSSAGFNANTFYDVVLTVSNAANNNVSAYLNGTQYFTVTSTDSNIATSFLNFFLDNPNNEYSNGYVALARLYDTPLTPGQVTSIYNNGNPFEGLGAGTAVPEPGIVALMSGSSIGGLLLWRRRRA